MGISRRVVLLNEFGGSIFPTTRIFGRLQLSKSSLLNILLIKSRVLKLLSLDEDPPSNCRKIRFRYSLTVSRAESGERVRFFFVYFFLFQRQYITEKVDVLLL